MTAAVRPFGSSDAETPVDVEIGRSGEYHVRVPGLGVLLVGQIQQPQGEPIVRLAAPEWHALLIQPDSQGRFSDESNHVRREVVVGDDGALSIELIPNASGEPRLVVVIEGRDDV